MLRNLICIFIKLYVFFFHFIIIIIIVIISIRANHVTLDNFSLFFCFNFVLQLMDINESPVYVLLNPSINPAQKDLPVTIYESGMQPNLYVIDRLITVIDTNVGFQGGKLLLYNLYLVLPCSLMVFLLCVWWSLVVITPELHVIDGIPQLIFVCSSYTIEVCHVSFSVSPVSLSFTYFSY